jgi:inosine/xanthosine triphosphatase
LLAFLPVGDGYRNFSSEVLNKLKLPFVLLCGLVYFPQMKTIHIAVGSLRAPKLDGVREAIAAIGALLDSAAVFKVVGVEVPSGVGHTPVSRAESMAGARNRAEELRELGRERNEPWRYFVGLEGGLDVVPENGHLAGNNRREGRIVFLESWAYVLDDTGVGAFGRSGGVEMPDALAAKVLEGGIELSAAVDAMTGERGIRDAQGAWGILTKNKMTRQDAFRTAAIAAFAKFFNATVYSSE